LDILVEAMKLIFPSVSFQKKKHTMINRENILFLILFSSNLESEILSFFLPMGQFHQHFMSSFLRQLIYTAPFGVSFALIVKWKSYK